MWTSLYEDAPERVIPELVEKPPKQKKDAVATRTDGHKNVVSRKLIHAGVRPATTTEKQLTSSAKQNMAQNKNGMIASGAVL